jgi:hypothetical protein
MPSDPRPERFPRHPRRRGLSARLWIGCLAGALTTLLASISVISAVAMAGTALDPWIVLQAIGGACLLGLAAAVLAASWLSRGVTQSLRELEDGIARGHLAPSSGAQPWGELGDVTHGVLTLLETDRDLHEDEVELRQLRESLDRAREAIERWIRSERWEPLTPGAGAFAPLAEALDRAITREVEVQDQNLEAAHLVHSELLRVVDEARGSAELAEHGYVEVTALLTTIREIARLTGEIQQTIHAPMPPSTVEPSPVESEWRERAAQAIEELVDVSGESVHRLGEGLVRVREINEQVQLLSNRATLIALNAIVAAGRPDLRLAPGEGPTHELKLLAREVRAATERVASLSDEIDRAVESANQRMREVREHVIARLVELPAPPAPAAAASPQTPPALFLHWVERLREMVQDAARKGERLSESHERASTAVQRVSHHLEDETRDLEGLVARLTPMGATSESAAAMPRTTDAESRGLHPLRLLDPEAKTAHPEDPSAGHEGGA